LFKGEPLDPKLKGRATFLTLKKLPTPKRGFSLPINPTLSRHGLGPYRSTYRDMPKNPDSFIHSNFYLDIECLLGVKCKLFGGFGIFPCTFMLLNTV
ncbi:MAG: hypothetical protein J6W63_08225, partial [Treponema sp.]|nr:hypothetical protein [Treponema sp.]